jgi:hypothetical protein
MGQTDMYSIFWRGKWINLWLNSIWSIHSLWNVHVNLRQVIVMSVSQSTDYVKCIYYDLDIRSLCLGQLFILIMTHLQINELLY